MLCSGYFLGLQPLSMMINFQPSPLCGYHSDDCVCSMCLSHSARNDYAGDKHLVQDSLSQSLELCVGERDIEKQREEERGGERERETNSYWMDL